MQTGAGFAMNEPVGGPAEYTRGSAGRAPGDAPCLSCGRVSIGDGAERAGGPAGTWRASAAGGFYDDCRGGGRTG